MSTNLYSSPEEADKNFIQTREMFGYGKVEERELVIPLDDIEFRKTWLLVHFYLGDEDRKNAIAWALRKEDYENAAMLKDMKDFMQDDKRQEVIYLGMKITKPNGKA